MAARTKFSAEKMFGPGGRRRGSTRHAEPESNPALEALWSVIAGIPRGRVSTYGDVARMAGLSGHARQTAYALRHAPEDMNLPWHRVLGAGGRIVFPKDSRQHREQARRLRADGVAVKDGRVSRTLLVNV